MDSKTGKKQVVMRRLHMQVKAEEEKGWVEGGEFTG